MIQPTARRLRRRDTAARERLRSLGAPDPATRARAALAAFGLTPASELDLVREAGLTRAEVPSVLAACDLIELPLGPRRSVRLPAELVAELELRLLRALDRLHAAHPRQTAIRRTHLAAALPDLGADAPIAALLDRLQQRGLVVGDAQAVARADHHPRLTQAEQTLAAQLASAVADGGFSPPDLTELTRRAGPRAASVPELLTLLADEGAVVEIGPGLYLSSRTEDELRRRVADRLTGDATITMAELRDLLGTTRRFAVPIGEYLDRIGLTRREGDLRRLARRDPDPLPG